MNGKIYMYLRYEHRIISHVKKYKKKGEKYI